MARCRSRLIVALALAVLAVRPSMADDIVSTWASVKWILANAPTSVSSHVTLTRSDMITYANGYKE